MEGGEELTLVDQPGLQRQQAEEQVTCGISGARHGGHLLIEAS
jgi:hypothetical protein